MAKVDNDGILEYLAAKVNSDCLSDLHYLSKEQVKSHLLEVSWQLNQ